MEYVVDKAPYMGNHLRDPRQVVVNDGRDADWCAP